VRALAYLRTSLVMCMKCSLNSSIGLMCTPNILYDLFGGRYVMWDPSRKDIVLICSWRDAWFFGVSGFPRAQSTPVASHFVVSSWRPVYLLKRCSFLSCILSCILRLCNVPAVMLTSSA
jgi:hypothetical protein